MYGPSASSPASARSDLYGAGLLLREMLLGIDDRESPTFSHDEDATVALDRLGATARDGACHAGAP
jgi:hypothetical protein